MNNNRRLDLAKLYLLCADVEVKTGILRNHLSRYLKRVRQTGDTIVVLDRNVPVAEIHPFHGDKAEFSSDVWSRRKQYEAQAGCLEEAFELPNRVTHPRKRQNPLD